MRVRRESLHRFCREALEAAGVPGDNAGLMATVLVETDLRGVHSHGVSLLPRYVHRIQTGLANPRPDLRVVREHGATAVLDGDNGMGHLVAHAAMSHAIGLARTHGIGSVAVRRSTHFGMAGYYAMMASREGMIGCATTNAGADMAPWQACEPILGTNPVAYAIPAGRHPDVVLDMATSVVAYGKIRMAHVRGERIPPGWVVGDHTDPQMAMKRPLLTFGTYKGSGLAVVVEILSAALPGALLSIEIGRSAPVGGERRDPRGIGHFFMAIDVEAFQPREEFRRRVDDIIDAVKGACPAPGYEEVLVPGEPEFRNRQAYLRDGIPLPPALVQELRRLGEQLHVVFPQANTP